MSQTLRNRIADPYWISFIKSINLVVIDEAHKQEFNYLFESNLLKDKYVIGFTATPKRSGKMRHLALDYETIINSLSVKEAIAQDYLVNDDYYGFQSPDMKDVKIDYMKGDYSERQMFEKFNTTKVYKGAVNNYLNICPGSKALIFCVNIEHCIKTCIEFQNNGVDARFVVSGVGMPKFKDIFENDGQKIIYEEKVRKYELYKEYFSKYSGDRAGLFKGFANKEFPVLINAGIATTGFDDPSIETIIVLRATMSTALWLQMLGRGSRIFPGKTHFNILDFGDNASRLGHYSENRIWSLWHEKYEGHGLPPIKNCGFESNGKPIVSNKTGCRRPILAAYKICPFCGFIYPEKIVKEIDLSNIVFDDSLRVSVKMKRIKDMTNSEIYEYWKMKGHKSAWLWRQLFLKGGSKAIEEFGREYKWSFATIDKAIQYCVNY
jgi:hypothetical protein